MLNVQGRKSVAGPAHLHEAESRAESAIPTLTLGKGAKQAGPSHPLLLHLCLDRSQLEHMADALAQAPDKHGARGLNILSKSLPLVGREGRAIPEKTVATEKTCEGHQNEKTDMEEAMHAGKKKKR